MAWFVGLLARALPLAVAIAAVPAMAQDYPTRPVTIVVGYTPGATSDLLARTVAERLNAAWGQSVIVDNRSGVGGNIAAAYVARAPADGYTLMVGTDAVHVPYRGGGATINDLLGGHIKVAFLSLSTAVPHLGSGKIKIVAVVERARYAAMPDIPTVGETVAGFEMSSWVAFFAPAA